MTVANSIPASEKDAFPTEFLTARSRAVLLRSLLAAPSVSTDAGTTGLPKLVAGWLHTTAPHHRRHGHQSQPLSQLSPLSPLSLTPPLSTVHCHESRTATAAATAALPGRSPTTRRRPHTVHQHTTRQTTRRVPIATAVTSPPSLAA